MHDTGYNQAQAEADATGETRDLRTVEQRLIDLEHDNNVMRGLYRDQLTAYSILRREFEEMTERNIKLVKRINEFLDRWTVA